MTRHHKLVRDFASDADKYQRVDDLDFDEFAQAVGARVLADAHALVTALRTMHRTEVVDGIADLREALDVAAKTFAIRPDEVTSARATRNHANGDFSARIVLDYPDPEKQLETVRVRVRQLQAELNSPYGHPHAILSALCAALDGED